MPKLTVWWKLIEEGNVWQTANEKQRAAVGMSALQMLVLISTHWYSINRIRIKNTHTALKPRDYSS